MGPQSQGNDTQLDGTLQLPDGRQVPVTVTVNWTELERAGISSLESTSRLLVRAIEVFGKAEKALSWLTTANPIFNGKTPLSEAQTENGRDRVHGALFDLEHGFPA